MIEWLQSLCDKSNPRIATPFAGEFEGARHVGATNGFAMVLVRSNEHAELTPPAFSVTGVFAKAGVERQVDILEFRTWANGGRPNREPCHICKGAKLIECRARCFNTDEEESHRKHFIECSRCAATGLEQRQKVRAGLVEGAVFNLNLLADFIPPEATGTVRLVIEKTTYDGGMLSGLLMLAAPEWRVAVIGIKDMVGSPLAIDYPAFVSRAEAR